MLKVCTQSEVMFFVFSNQSLSAAQWSLLLVFVGKQLRVIYLSWQNIRAEYEWLCNLKSTLKWLQMFQPFCVHTQTLNKINGRPRPDPTKGQFLFDIVQKISGLFPFWSNEFGFNCIKIIFCHLQSKYDPYLHK